MDWGKGKPTCAIYTPSKDDLENSRTPIAKMIAIANATNEPIAFHYIGDWVTFHPGDTQESWTFYLNEMDFNFAHELTKEVGPPSAPSSHSSIWRMRPLLWGLFGLGR